jgi:hypothetical protein
LLDAFALAFFPTNSHSPRVSDDMSTSDTDVALFPDPRGKLSKFAQTHKDFQVTHIQRILMFYLNQKDTPSKVVPALACAWERLENRLNRMRMKPEPRPVDVAKLAKTQTKIESSADPDDT